MSPIPRLTGNQIGKFADALVDAYDYLDLDMMLRYRLDKKLSVEAPVVSPITTYSYACLQPVARVGQQGCADAFLLTACEPAPGHSSLLAFAQQLGLAAGLLSTQANRNKHRGGPDVSIPTALRPAVQ